MNLSVSVFFFIYKYLVGVDNEGRKFFCFLIDFLEWHRDDERWWWIQRWWRRILLMILLCS